MRKVLVTGASGYIGSFLVRSLLADGLEVIALIRSGTRMTNLEGLVTLRTTEYDGLSSSVLEVIGEEQPDVIFHLAAFGGAADHGFEDLDRIIDANIVLGAQLLEALRQVGNGALINTGTFAQHYEGKAAYDPGSFYAASKQAYEDIVTYYVRVEGVPVVTLKLFDVYGPYDARPKLFTLLRKAQQENVPLAVSPGEQLLDLVYVDDVVQAYRRAARLLEEQPSIAGNVYAVSSGVRRTVRDTVAVFEEVSGKPVPVIWGGRAYRKREIMVPWEGVRLPGWSAEVPLAEGLRRVLNELESRSSSTFESPVN